FLISVLVSIMKLITSADIGLGLSFYAFALFGVFLTATIVVMDIHQIWDWLLTPEYPNTGFQGGALDQQLTACHVCYCNVPLSQSYCQRCGSAVSARKPYSIQRTWAFLFVAMLLYVPANILPIMQTRLFGKDELNTILGGIQVLWSNGSYPVAVIIFIASIMVPIAKMFALSWLNFSVMFHNPERLQEKTLLYRITEFVGRWSMLDVFVVAILTSLIHQGKILAVYPGPAIVAFAGVVIFTLLAAKNFDPRLLWDQSNHENH
ncbi:MAG: paraquat-inducible protein A, partial [Cycloclasticus sp.]|nr:paraquat-inducible protein A [Cycloclasticus sp.]